MDVELTIRGVVEVVDVVTPVGTRVPGNVVRVVRTPMVVDVEREPIDVVVDDRATVVVVVVDVVVVVVVVVLVVDVVVVVSAGGGGAIPVVVANSSADAALVPAEFRARIATVYGVPGIRLGIVNGGATAPVPKLVHVAPASVVHSYDSMAAPPFDPAVNEIDIVVVVTAIDVIVGGDGTIALTTKLLETFVATR